MKPKILLRALCATACIAAAAPNIAWPQASDSSIASLKSVVGNVLVSKDTGLASGNEDVRLTRGSRVITTTNSEAVVKYDNGCEVRLKPNQRFEVDADKPCELLIAQVESILTEPVEGVAVATGSIASYAAPAIGAAATTLLIIQSRRQGSAVSPN